MRLAIKCRNLGQRRRVILKLRNFGIKHCLYEAPSWERDIVDGKAFSKAMFIVVWEDKNEVLWGVSSKKNDPLISTTHHVEELP